MLISDIIGGTSVTMQMVLPNEWASERKKGKKAVWLLHDSGKDAAVWVMNLPLELLSDAWDVSFLIPSLDREAACRDSAPGCTWETFLTEDLRGYVLEMLPMLSEKPEDQMLFGKGAGALTAARLGRTYPALYGRYAGYQGTGDSLKDWEECGRRLQRELREWTDPGAECERGMKAERKDVFE